MKADIRRGIGDTAPSLELRSQGTPSPRWGRSPGSGGCRRGSNCRAPKETRRCADGDNARSCTDGRHRDASQKSFFSHRLCGRMRATPSNSIAMNYSAGKTGNQVSNWRESRSPISDRFRSRMETRPPSALKTCGANFTRAVTAAISSDFFGSRAEKATWGRGFAPMSRKASRTLSHTGPSNTSSSGSTASVRMLSRGNPLRSTRARTSASTVADDSRWRPEPW